MAIRILGPDQCKPFVGPRNPLRPDGINRVAYGSESELCEDWATAQDPYAVARILEQAQGVLPLGWLEDYAILCPAQRLVILDEAGAPMEHINGERFDGWIVVSGTLETGLADPLRDVLLHELAHEVAKRFIGATQQAEFFALTNLPVGDNQSTWQARPQELIAEYLSAAIWDCPLDLRMVEEFGEPLPEALAVVREWALNLVGDWQRAPVEVVGEKRTVTLTIGFTVATVNGKPVTMDVAPILMGGRTMVPLRFLVETFGFVVDWNGETRTVTISR